MMSDTQDAESAKYYDQDYTQLQHIITAFEFTTGLRVSILLKSHYDEKPAYRTPMFLQRIGHHNPYCSIIKSSPMAKGCGGYDGVTRASKAQELGRPFIDECPFGVVEIIIPLIVRGEFVGTIFCGQVRRNEDTEVSFDRAWERAQHRMCNKEHLKQAFAEFKYFTDSELMMIGSLLFNAISNIADSLDDITLEREIKIRHNSLVRNTIALLQQRIRDLPNEGEIAEQLGISREYFSRLFHRVMNKNYVQYVTELRIARAQELLTNTTLPIVDIAEEVGYKHQSYFARKFRQLSGMTPRQFRASSSLL
jgi:AraC-like DNA-binding protein